MSRPTFNRGDVWALSAVRSHSSRSHSAGAFAAATTGAEPLDDDAAAVFSVEMSVRDTEVDLFGVVNNNNFGIYFQHGECMQAISIGCPPHADKGLIHQSLLRLWPRGASSRGSESSVLMRPVCVIPRLPLALQPATSSSLRSESTPR